MDFEDVFTAFGGPTKLAQAIGIPPQHAITMRHRGSIPPLYWTPIVEAARKKRIRGITYEAFVMMRQRRRAS